jgi:hypothetical protein
MYLISSGFRAMYSFSTWLATTWEFVLINSVFAPSAFALLSPSIRPSYSAMLFVALNSSLAAYFVQSPDGATSTAEALAPDWPHAPSVNTIHVLLLGYGLF